jgi:hypothetical protein
MDCVVQTKFRGPSDSGSSTQGTNRAQERLSSFVSNIATVMAEATTVDACCNLRSSSLVGWVMLLSLSSLRLPFCKQSVHRYVRQGFCV